MSIDWLIINSYNNNVQRQRIKHIFFFDVAFVHILTETDETRQVDDFSLQASIVQGQTSPAFCRVWTMCEANLDNKLLNFSERS